MSSEDASCLRNTIRLWERKPIKKYIEFYVIGSFYLLKGYLMEQKSTYSKNDLVQTSYSTRAVSRRLCILNSYTYVAGKPVWLNSESTVTVVVEV